MSDGTTTSTTTPTTSTSQPSGTLTWSQVQEYWIQAGGNPQAAGMAAAVADASSGLAADINRTLPGGSTGVGLWLIPQDGSPPGTTDPLANARAAVAQSNNGTDWSSWCAAWSDNACGQNGGQYLGPGSNALMALAGQATSTPYKVIGSSPASSGVGASAATGSSTATGTSSGTNYVLIALLIGGIVLAVYLWRRHSQGGATETPVEQSPPTEEEM